MKPTKLNSSPNLTHPDDLYQSLLAMQNGLSPEESLRVCAKLILLLANHIGDEEVIREAMQLARETADG